MFKGLIATLALVLLSGCATTPTAKKTNQQTAMVSKFFKLSGTDICFNSLSPRENQLIEQRKVVKCKSADVTRLTMVISKKDILIEGNSVAEKGGYRKLTGVVYRSLTNSCFVHMDGRPLQRTIPCQMI